MPNSHFDVAIYSRKYGSSRGKDQKAKAVAAAERPEGYSVMASAAYQSGDVLRNDKLGLTYDFRNSQSRRQDDVRHKEILTPEGVADSWKDRQTLWARVEQEKRKDAQLAKSIVGALPRELTLEENIELVRDFVRENLTSKGMIADIAIHDVLAMDGKSNIHVHMLVTLREIDGETFSRTKNREWNNWNAKAGKAESVDPLRASWETITNKHLANAGSTERVSLKSFKDQGINRHPTIHLGEDAGSLEKRGVETVQGNYNRKAQHENALIEILEPEYAEFQGNELGEGSLKEPEREVSGHQQNELGFLNDTPAMRLEAMTLELKDDQADPGDAVIVSGGEASVNSFKKEDEDTKKLAQDSLNASRAAHDAALLEYLDSSSHSSQRAQVTEMTRLKDYARRSAERVKEFTGKIYRQFSNLMKETEWLKGRDRDDHER